MVGSRDACIDRHFGLDWLRIGAFAILILYHIGMFFAPGSWLVKAPETIEAVAWPMAAVQPWRMPLLFVVSGFASCALLRKSAGIGGFARARSARLLLPLLFGVCLLVPPQTWIGLTENHGYRESLPHFWLTEWFSFDDRTGVALPSEEHLWFIAYLWTYTMVLAVGLRLAPAGWSGQAKRLIEWLGRDARLVWAPLLPLLVLRIGVLFTIPEKHGLLHDWVSDLIYLPAFLFGFALAANPELWGPILRARRLCLGVAASCLVLLLSIEMTYGDALSHVSAALHRDAQLAMAWATILLMLGFAHQYLNRDHPLRARLSDAVFPFYLAHQTIIVATGWWLRGTGLSPSLMFFALLAATILGCWAFHELGRRAGPLRILFGLSRQSRPRPLASPGEVAVPA